MCVSACVRACACVCVRVNSSIIVLCRLVLVLACLSCPSGPKNI